MPVRFAKLSTLAPGTKFLLGTRRSSPIFMIEPGRTVNHRGWSSVRAQTCGLIENYCRLFHPDAKGIPLRASAIAGYGMSEDEFHRYQMLPGFGHSWCSEEDWNSGKYGLGKLLRDRCNDCNARYMIIATRDDGEIDHTMLAKCECVSDDMLMVYDVLSA